MNQPIDIGKTAYYYRHEILDIKRGVVTAIFPLTDGRFIYEIDSSGFPYYTAIYRTIEEAVEYALNKANKA